MAALALDNAVAAYGDVRVLEGITLRVAHGEHVALVGGSGAGKSTLLNLLYAPDRDDIALIPQDLGLVPALSVFHNVYMGQLAHRGRLYSLINLIRPFRREVDAVRAICDDLGLAEKLWSPVAELSGGQRQRTAVARAVYQDGDILLADEPVSALDRPRAEQVMETLTQRYATSVAALHDVELALRFTTRIIGIDAGRIVLDAPSNTLRRDDLAPLYAGELEAAE